MDLAVVLAFVVTIAGDILVPLALGAWCTKRFGISWRIFGLGAGFFVLVQIFHTPLVLAAQTPIYQYLQSTLADQTLALAAFAIVLGLLAGVFEEVGRYLVFAWFFRRRGIALSKENGLLFGIGWGGVESIIIGILVVLTLVSYMAAAPLTDQQIQAINQSVGGTLTEEQIEQIQAQMDALINLTPFDVLPGFAERMMTITLHVAFTLMVLSAVVHHRQILLVLAILWHTAVDALAVYLSQTAGILATELAILAMALLAAGYIWWAWRDWDRSASSGDLS